MTITDEQKEKYYKTRREKYAKTAKTSRHPGIVTNTREGNLVAHRKYLYKIYYGITVDEYNSMFENQSGCCCICGKHQTEFTQRLSIDHDHVTGNIRGLLCKKCNGILGYAEDDISVLEKAILYLRG